MSNPASRYLSADPEIERLLRDYADCNVGEPPKIDIVQHAMAAIAEPCVEQSRSVSRPHGAPSALIVLCLAAATIFVAAISGSKRQPHTSQATEMGSVSVPQTGAVIAGSGRVADQSSSAGQPFEAEVFHTIVTKGGPILALRNSRPSIQPAEGGALKATWTSTVVRRSEQGVVLPITTTDDDGTEGQTQQGVAVVPLQSGLTYTDYKGGNEQ